ncbi:hypothetical protein C5167_004123 [Papaver somniferum]|uniref:late embryogenesis abundant protein Dc3-like n=1 Tax=Papaver somniferum TaxID=3469 RepID=UPI000E6FF7B8|nr:late embryogenesis abundant protein Dc3-like [Papaver somniferum]RZC87944.1 hypothetical protein C5167_004123 [Papaver somniferum]
MYADQRAVDKAGENIASAAQATKEYVVGAAQPEKEATPGFLESAKNTANTAGGHVATAAQATKDYVVGAAPPEKEETPGFLQQTGTAVVNTAQGAVEAVKNTIGMNDEKK